MNESENSSARNFFAGFPRGDASDEEILKFHLRRFHRYQFQYADIATFDGEELTALERGLMLCNTTPSEGRVEVQGEPSEALYIDYMIKLIEDTKLDIRPFEVMNKADRYLDFLQERKEKVSRPESKLPEQKEFRSLRRVYSFILTEAFLKGTTQLKTMSKPAFIKYVKEKFNVKSGNSIYQTVRSTYKGESNFINFIGTMKQDHSLDYEYAMKIFHEYYPDLV